MPSSTPHPTRVLILALSETAGSALYGMVDVLMTWLQRKFHDGPAILPLVPVPFCWRRRVC